MTTQPPSAKPHPFDVEAFLSRPLVARLAAAGPTVRPIWFLWEEGAFWWITGAYARLPQILERDPAVALVVDTCDLETMQIYQVNARGRAEVVPYDAGRGHRKLSRYLGQDESTWHADFRDFGPDTRFVRLVPDRLLVKDLSKPRPVPDSRP